MHLWLALVKKGPGVEKKLFNERNLAKEKVLSTTQVNKLEAREFDVGRARAKLGEGLLRNATSAARDMRRREFLFAALNALVNVRRFEAFPVPRKSVSVFARDSERSTWSEQALQYALDHVAEDVEELKRALE